MQTIPSVLKTPVLLVSLLLIPLLFGASVESLRLRLLRTAVKPLGIFGVPGTGVMAPADIELLRAVENAGREALGPYAACGGTPLPVLDLDPEGGWLLVAGGTEQGVQPGAHVVTPEGCVGVVDRVTAHVSRARLLSASGVSLAIQVRDLGRTLPGDIPFLVGTLEGTGGGAIIARSHLPESFREGDLVLTQVVAGETPRPVARVSKAGVRPEVDLLARTDTLRWVVIPGVVRGPIENDLFGEASLDVVAVGGALGRGTLLLGVDAGNIESGTAVRADRWYLGRIVRTGAGCAWVHSVGERGTTTRVQVIDAEGKLHPALLEGAGEGALELKRWLGPAPASGPVVVATSGGQELVPPGLLVGAGRWHDGRLEIERPPSWPKEAVAAVFRFAADRRRLVGTPRQ